MNASEYAFGVVVTGSRRWRDEEIIERDLNKLHSTVSLAHGACPYGADSIVDKIWSRMGRTGWRFPAGWNLLVNNKPLGRRAGPIRNNEMLRFMMPRIVIAYLCPDSVGTIDCIKQASLIVPGATLWLRHSNGVSSEIPVKYWRNCV